MSATLEQIVRVFDVAQSLPRLEYNPPPRLLPVAFIRWGQASTFEGHNFRDDASMMLGPSVAEPDDPEPPKRLRLTYSVGRSAQRVVYTNPNDSDQYVIIEEANGLVGRGGLYSDEFVLSLSPREVGTESGSGQEPPEPPPMEELDERGEWLAWKNRQSVFS